MSDEEVEHSEGAESVPRQGANFKFDPPMKMLKFMGEASSEVADPAFIFVPVSQAVGLVTEDMLEEQQHALESQMDMEGSSQSQQHQSQLRSDMEAFKAANPGCVMADFVRWCSPADWEAIQPSDGAVAISGDDGIQN